MDLYLVGKIQETEDRVITLDITIEKHNSETNLEKLRKFGKIYLYSEGIQNVILECSKRSALKLAKQYNAKKLPYITSVDIYEPVIVSAHEQ